MTDPTRPVMAAPDLAGVTALVTGGTSGLGLAMVRALAAHGAAVAFTSRSAHRARRTEADVPGTLGLVADATDATAVERAVDAAWSGLGSIGLFVNNAGIGMRTVNPLFMTEPMPFWRMPVDGFRAVVDTNLTGYFIAARAVAPRMAAAGSGRIVNISINHSTMTRRGFVPYGPSRAGSEALSRVMAADLAGSGVRVNLLLPGGATATGMLPEGGRVPEGMRVADPAVMGAPIVWLAGAEARGAHDQRIVATEFDGWLARWRAEQGQRR